MTQNDSSGWAGGMRRKGARKKGTGYVPKNISQYDAEEHGTYSLIRIFPAET